MSQTITPDRLLEERGDVRTLEAFVVGAAYDRSGSVAFALGDGSLRIVRKGGEWQAGARPSSVAQRLPTSTRHAGKVIHRCS